MIIKEIKNINIKKNLGYDNSLCFVNIWVGVCKVEK